jgi:transcriptional regulator with XRE-family HTH domain
LSVAEARLAKRGHDPRDADIAKRLRTLRLQRGWSQADLGNVLGVSFQQVQKYERGTNRIAAGRLARIAETLEVPVVFFYGDDKARRSEPSSGFSSIAIEFDFLQTDGAMRLARAYSRIDDAGVRLSLLRLAESLADG